MPPRNWKIRVGDILECIAKIEKHTDGFDFVRFEEDDKTIDAVLRNLEIIGEAAKHISPQVRKRYSDLPWKEMQTLRNLVIHEYHGVNLKIVWQTVTEDLPPIVDRLKEILEDDGNSE